MSDFQNNVILACAERAYGKIGDASQGISMKLLIESIKVDLGVLPTQTLVAHVLKLNHWTEKHIAEDGYRKIVYLAPSTEFNRAVRSVNLVTLILFLEKALAESKNGSDGNVNKLIGASICIAHVLNGMKLSDEMVRNINDALLTD